MIKRILLPVLVTILLSACSKSASPALPTVTPAPAAAQTTVAASADSTAVVLPALPEVTPTTSASPTPFLSFEVKPSVDSLKLRLGPGYLFDALILLNTTDTLTVQGKAPGGEWVYVATADGTEGWVFAQLLETSIDLQAIPVIEPDGVVLIKGVVKDINGTPIQGVGFDVRLGTEEGAPTNVVVTDASGQFYSYLPPESSGDWTVTYSAIACNSNVWADSSCSAYKPGYSGSVDPQSQAATLPQSGELRFTWK